MLAIALRPGVLDQERDERRSTLQPTEEQVGGRRHIVAGPSFRDLATSAAPDLSGLLFSQKKPTAALQAAAGLREQDAWERCDRSFWLALVLTLLLFGMGMGRFYLGHLWIGWAQVLLSLSLCFVAGKGFSGFASLAIRHQEEEAKGEEPRGFLAAAPGVLGWLAPILRIAFVGWLVLDVCLLCTGALQPSC